VPLLIQANTNDEDVTAREVAKLIEALKLAGKDFQYHLYTNAPGGHLFNRLDTKLARDSRDEIYAFLARQLKPPHPDAWP
jgi:dienelactone hydrolase